MSLIPTTILTGFLGAGKTTLLNRLLHENHGHRIAVIENEFGEENIDNEILVQETQEHIVEMSNGCVCCTVRGDLIAALGQLAQKRREGALQFDRVVIETTGLANPGPVAQTFFMDDEVATSYLLDGVITVIDASNAMPISAKEGKGVPEVLEAIIEAVETRATLGEISDTLRTAFGEYHETATL